MFYFQEKVQIIVAAMSKAPEKHAAELYFDKLTKLSNQIADSKEVLKQKEFREAICINSNERSLDAKTIANTHTSTKLRRQHNLKINIVLEKDLSHDVRTAVEVYSKSTTNNANVVNNQLEAQNSAIKNKLLERRMSSLNKSNSNQSRMNSSLSHFYTQKFQQDRQNSTISNPVKNLSDSQLPNLLANLDDELTKK
jgi:hypothetical protein